MTALPTGTVTFLFTDIEGSTPLWERDPEAMRHALARHDALIEAAVAEHQGALVRPRGEGGTGRGSLRRCLGRWSGANAGRGCR